MRFILASARKDLLHILRDPAGLAVWLGIPVVLLTLLTVFFGGDRIAPKGTLLITDHDDSLVSSFFTGAFSQRELGKMFTTEKVDETEGQRRIDRGEASALLIIPAGLGEAFLNRKPFQLKLYKNPSQSILPSIVEEVLSVLTEGAFYVQAAAGDELTVFQSRPTDAAMAEAVVRFRRLGDAARGVLDPPLIEVLTRLPPAKPEKRTPIGTMLLPGMLMLSIMFVSQGMAAEIWRERTKGTLRRVASSPSLPSQWLLGRALAAAGMLGAITATAMLAGHFALKMRYDNIAGAFLWTVFAGTMFYLAIAAIQFYSLSDRAAATFTNLLVLPLALAGGSIMPFEALPETAARIGKLTPNGAAVAQLRAFTEGGFDSARLLSAGAGLLLLGCAGFLLSLLALRRGFAARN